MDVAFRRHRPQGLPEPLLQALVRKAGAHPMVLQPGRKYSEIIEAVESGAVPLHDSISFVLQDTARPGSKLAIA